VLTLAKSWIHGLRRGKISVEVSLLGWQPTAKPMALMVGASSYYSDALKRFEFSSLRMVREAGFGNRVVQEIQMVLKHVITKREGLVVALCAIVALAGWITSIEGDRGNARPVPMGEFIGESRFVSVEALPETDGAMCEWVPASSQTSLRSALQQGHIAERSTTSSVSSETAALLWSQGLDLGRGEWAVQFISIRWSLCWCLERKG
jgi:hypothetical protein